MWPVLLGGLTLWSAFHPEWVLHSGGLDLVTRSNQQNTVGVMGVASEIRF